MDLEALRLKIEADTAKAQRAVEKLSDILKKQRQELKANNDEAEKGGEDAVKGFSKWSSAYFRALGLVNQFGSAVKSAYEAAADGAKIQAAESFFKNAGKSITDLRAATGGMISDAELMKKANLADSMGISMDTFKSLAKVAQASALKTGQSFDHMFESIVVGTARSSRLLLDNLGIIISVKDANENYARAQLKLAGDTNITNKEIKDFVDKMDDVAKKTAFAEEVQRKAVGTLGEYAGAAVEAAENFGKFETSIENFKDTLKKNLVGPFSDLASYLTPVVQKLDDMVKALNSVPQGTLAALASAAAVIGGAVGGAAIGGVLGLPGMAVGAVLGGVAGGAGAVSTFSGKAAETRAGQIDMLNALEEDVRAVFVDPLDVVGKNSQTLADEFSFLSAESLAIVQSFASLNELLGNVILPKMKAAPKGGQTEGAGKGKDGAGKAFTKISETMLDPKYAHDWLAAVKELHKMQVDAAKEVQKTNKELVDLYGTSLPFSSIAKPVLTAGRDKRSLDSKLTAEEQEAAERLEKMADEAHNAELAFRDWAKSAAGGVTTGLATGTGAFGPLLSSFASMAGDAISGLLTTALGAAGGGAVGAIVAALLPVIGSLLDELKPVTDLLTGVATGLANFVKFGLGELVAGLGDLARPIQLLLTALGMAVGALLRPLANMLTPIIQGLAFVVQLLAAGLTAITFVFDIIGYIITGVGGFVVGLISLFLPMEKIIGDISGAIETAAYHMIYSAIEFNNAVVDLVRSWGLEGFGRYMKYEDFIQVAEEEEKNTKAVEENTRAVRDLAREFRNMPAGYKVARTVYDAADAVMQPQQSVVLTMSETAASAVSRRWRT